MSQFVPVARGSELSPGQMKVVVADQERLLLVNMAGAFYVISDACGHDWAPLSRGKVEGPVFYCPRHFPRYGVRTGQLLSGPMADDVPIYEESREMLGVMPLPGSLPPQGPCLDTSA